MKPAPAFGEVLRRLRGEVGYSQAKLGIEANLWRNFIGMLERGERQPTLTTIFKLAKALNCSASALVRLVEVEVRSESRRK